MAAVLIQQALQEIWSGFNYGSCVGFMLDQPVVSSYTTTMSFDADWQQILERMEDNQKRHKEEYTKWTLCALGWKAQYQIEMNDLKEIDINKIRGWMHTNVYQFANSTLADTISEVGSVVQQDPDMVRELSSLMENVNL